MAWSRPRSVCLLFVLLVTMTTVSCSRRARRHAAPSRTAREVTATITLHREGHGEGPICHRVRRFRKKVGMARARANPEASKRARSHEETPPRREARLPERQDPALDHEGPLLERQETPLGHEETPLGREEPALGRQVGPLERQESPLGDEEPPLERQELPLGPLELLLVRQEPSLERQEPSLGPQGQACRPDCFSKASMVG